MLVNEPQDLREPSFSELGRNSVFIEVTVVLLIILCSLLYRSCENLKLMIVTFYNCDFKLYLDISSVLELVMN